MSDNTSPTVPAPDAAQKEDGRKIFVGNLSFSVGDSELSAFFASVGKVVTANVISRGTRSLGYGFVTFETEEDAQKAYELLNRKEFNGREINVEIAKDRDPTAPRRGGMRGGFRGGRGRPQFNGYNQFDYRYPRYDDFAYGGFGFGGRGGGRFRGRGGPRGARAPRGIDRKTGEQSKTTLFIANLPFAVDDNALANLFGGYQVVKSHVITNKNGRSKGFGFVEFANEAEQQKALVEMINTTIDGRALNIKIALNEEHANTNDEETVTETA